jgi:preprotein translocase subunit SecA
MTGTADTEATEFQQIYGLEVIVIPSHKKMIRKDHVDLVFLTVKEKYEAIIKNIISIHNTGQPVLVGTTSIESSEYISKLLKTQKIKHHVLNAKQHQKEAEIIAQAGKLSAVTIATNMAGRGTDIVLGGKDMTNEGINSSLDNPDDIKKIGGLYIIGTERHESRRVDNQLRGRSGRQGDPGESRFYLSLEDNLMRIFASDKVTEIMKKLGMEDGEAIEHKWVSKSIENAQKRVEAYNFDIRKTLLEYDDIANEQRKVIYNQRNDILSADDLSSIYNNILSFACEELINNYIPLDIPSSQWDYDAINESFKNDFAIEIKSSEIIKNGDHEGRVTFKNYIRNIIFTSIQSSLDILSEEDKKELIRNIFLSVIDEDWRNHLNAMDYLRQGIGLRSYAQKNPKNEYKRESFEMFEEMLSVNNLETIKILTKIKINNSNVSDKLIKDEALNANMDKKNANVSRNALCPCGSGKKYKRCCGRL